MPKRARKRQRQRRRDVPLALLPFRGATATAFTASHLRHSELDVHPTTGDIVAITPRSNNDDIVHTISVFDTCLGTIRYTHRLSLGTLAGSRHIAACWAESGTVYAVSCQHSVVSITHLSLTTKGPVVLRTLRAVYRLLRPECVRWTPGFCRGI